MGAMGMGMGMGGGATGMGGGTEDDELAAAIAASLDTNDTHGNDDDDDGGEPMSIGRPVRDDAGGAGSVVVDATGSTAASGTSGAVDAPKQPPTLDDAMAPFRGGAALEPEPEKGTPGTTSVSFRLADGKRCVRRFRTADVVAVCYKFILERLEEETAAGGVVASFDLRAGFPRAESLRGRLGETLEEAQLCNAMVTVILD